MFVLKLIFLLLYLQLVAIKIVDKVADNIEEIEEEYLALSTHWIHPNIPHIQGTFLKKGLSR